MDRTFEMSIVLHVSPVLSGNTFNTRTWANEESPSISTVSGRYTNSSPHAAGASANASDEAAYSATGFFIGAPRA